MRLAPMPNHRNTNDPYWIRLFQNYGHIIRPLRERGFVTDFDISDWAYYIHAALPDGSHLNIVADEGGLPTNPLDVKGWRVCRHHDDNPTVSDLIYDSTFTGSAMLNKQLRSPLFAAVDAYLLRRGLTEPWRAAFQPVALKLQHITADGTPRLPEVRPYVGRQYAAQSYDRHHQSLYEDGWQRIYAHPSRDWPRSAWTHGDALLHLGITATEFATSTDTDRG